MKKKTAVIVICVILALILLIPIPMHRGSTEYHALLYSVTDVHRLTAIEAETEFEDGLIVRIL